MLAGLGVQLGILSQLYSGMMSRILDGFDLTYPQFAPLMHVSRRREASRVSDLVAAVDLTQSAVTKAIQKFTMMGLVEVSRDSTDQRNRPIRVTEAGRQHVLQV
jgi:DNA-binding MarR family transcriptional regulator